jgi:hypothetical protein
LLTLSFFKKIIKSSFLIPVLFLFQSLFLVNCDFKKSDSAGGTYVKPSIDYKGRMRKGYVRRKVSTDKNAIKNQNRSRYYYQTRGKYRRKKH